MTNRPVLTPIARMVNHHVNRQPPPRLTDEQREQVAKGTHRATVGYASAVMRHPRISVVDIEEDRKRRMAVNEHQMNYWSRMEAIETDNGIVVRERR